MLITHLIYALLIGLGIAWLIHFTLDNQGPWNNFIWFVIVITLFSWGGGVWLVPFGPTGWGVSWLPFLAAGIFITLLMLAASPQSTRSRKASKRKAMEATNRKEEAAEEKAVEMGLDVFFWILIVFMVAMIFSHYNWHPGQPMPWTH